MATGVEMLGQMSEDINLAGPVQGGNMVVKPNEAPVGAAAMLSKQLRNQANKGVAGIYELPEPQDNMPAFMRIAQEGIERQTAGQRNMYPNNFADDEGGILELPRNLRTAPGVPETSLAYITDEEKAILGLLKPGTPHRGPEDVPSYDSMDYTPSTSTPKGATQSSFDAVSQGGGTQQQQDFVQQFQQSEAGKKIKEQLKREQQQDQQGSGQYNTQADIEKAIQDTGARTGIDTDNISNLLSDPKKVKENKEEKLINDIEKAVEDGDASAIEKFANDAKTMGTDIGSLIKNLSSGAGSIISGIFDFDNSDKKDGKKKNKKSFIEDLLSGGTFGAIMDKISKPTEESFMDNNYKAIMKDKYFDDKGNIKPGMEDDFERFTREYSDLLPDGMDTGNPNEMKSMKEVIMSGTVPEGSDLERRLNPDKYWSENKPVSSLDFKDMAEAQAQGKLAFTKANTQAIQQGRELLSRDRGGNQNNRPRFMQETQEEEVVETPDGVIDEEAQTMKYTGPRTGDKEVNVPLNRRFRTDPTKDVAQYRTAPRTEADIYKYMTEGTTGEGIGLEPFSEYQRRRRKAMGLEPLGLYG